jgi:hypothetical protein
MSILGNLTKRFFRRDEPSVSDNGGISAEVDPRYYEFSLLTGDSAVNRWFDERTELPEDRGRRRELYDDMDRDFVEMILNMYANDATQFNLKANATIWIESTNKQVREICTELLKRLEIEENAFPMVRSIIKYGEEFDLLTYTPNRIESWSPVSGLTYTILDPNSKNLLGYSLKSETDPDYSLPWDFIPFILKGKDRSRKYGTSMLDPLYSINAKYLMMEDAAAVYRILQMPDRDVYYVDCTGCSVTNAERRLQQVKNTVNKQRYVDSSKTRVSKNFKFPGSATGIMVLPIFRDRQDRMEKQSSQSRVQDVYDLEHFLRRLTATASIPPERLGLEFSGGIQYDSSKSLTMQDVQYARMIKRPQRTYLRGLVLACEIELCLRGIDPTKKENSFKVAADPVSFLEEIQRQDLYEARLGVVDSFTRISRDLGIEGKEWARYLLTTFGGFTPEMIDLVYGDQGEESTSSSLSEDVKQKLAKEYENNPVLQKRITETMEYISDIFSDAITRASEGSKLTNASLMESFELQGIRDWSSDVKAIRQELSEARRLRDSQLIEIKRAELKKYITGPTREFKGGNKK